jgi:hypothetical protein
MVLFVTYSNFIDELPKDTAKSYLLLIGMAD